MSYQPSDDSDDNASAFTTHYCRYEMYVCIKILYESIKTQIQINYDSNNTRKCVTTINLKLIMEQYEQKESTIGPRGSPHNSYL